MIVHRFQMNPKKVSSTRNLGVSIAERITLGPRFTKHSSKFSHTWVTLRGSDDFGSELFTTDSLNIRKMRMLSLDADKRRYYFFFFFFFSVHTVRVPLSSASQSLSLWQNLPANHSQELQSAGCMNVNKTSEVFPQNKLNDIVWFDYYL